MLPRAGEYAVYLVCNTFNPAEGHLKGKVDPAQTWLQRFGTGLESALVFPWGEKPTVWLTAMTFSLESLGSDLDQPFQQFRNSQALTAPVRPTTCVYPVFGLNFQKERGSDRDCGVWSCIGLPHENNLSLYGITENSK